EAAAEALAHAPERAASVLSEGRAGAEWRRAFGLPDPSPQLDAAIEGLGNAVRAASPAGNPRTLEALAAALRDDGSDEQDLEGLVRRVLLAMIEERGTRQPRRP